MAQKRVHAKLLQPQNYVIAVCILVGYKPARCGCSVAVRSYGDAFNAGYAVAIVEGVNPETSVRFAQATSAISVTGLGSQSSAQSLAHILEFTNACNARA
jgi:bifunctional ADP-heptose synthase (sugar kinase/adenylyltransferase)